jgi:hypothetical protein
MSATLALEKYFHVVPVGDLKAHLCIGLHCWCSPDQEENVVIHHAADGREAYETGQRQLN